MSWRDLAMCAGRTSPDPDLQSRPTNVSYAKAAQRYCQGCPVVVECAQDALDHGDHSVVRAGVYLFGANGYRRAASTQALQDVVATAPRYHMRHQFDRSA